MTKPDLSDFIGVFDEALPPDLCTLMIREFEMNYGQRLAFSRKLAKPGMLIDDDSVDYNSPDEPWIFTDGGTAERLCMHLKSCFDYYSTECGGGFIGIEPTHLNCVKLQRTSPGQGYHVWHCEQGSRQSAHKFMFYIAYLNDVDEGGETEFLHQARRIAPKEGRVLLAPASFTHIHRGNPPLSNTKYIATGWFEW